MRRKDREVTDPVAIRSVIESAYCCRLGFCDSGEVYIVPLNFGYEETEGNLVFYFHSAPEGRKMDLVRTVGRVGFELDTDYVLRMGEDACSCTAAFRSIIGTGRVRPVSDPEEKLHALRLIMEHSTGRGNLPFSDSAVSRVAVIRLDVESLSCKQHE